MDSMVNLSVNSWHFKLNEWVLGNLAPNPRTMHNLCPYFWLSICSIILVIPVTIVKLIILLFVGIANVFNLIIIEPAEKRFYYKMKFDRKFQEEMAIMYFYDNCRYHPWFMSRVNFSNEVTKWFAAESKKSREKEVNFDKIKSSWKSTSLHREVLEKEKAKIHVPSKPKMFENIQDSLEDFSKSIKESWGNFKMSQVKLIKYTQRFIGLVLSAGLALITYFILLYVSKGILWVFYNTSGEDWLETLLCLGIGIGMILICVGIVHLIIWLKNNFTMKPKRIFWRFIVYVFIYPIFWPLYFIFAVLLWRWILQGFLWTLLCKTIIWGSLKAFWSFLMGFVKVFKSYFGLAYSDYCPGVEWKEE